MSDENGTPGDKNLRYLGLIIAIIAIVVAISVAILQYSPPPPNFDISIEPMQGEVQQGDAIEAKITVKGYSDYDYNVRPSASGPLSGIVISFTPPIREAKPPYTSRVKIKVDPGVPAGEYTIKINGSGADGIERSCKYHLTVNPMPFTPTPTPTPTPQIYQALFDETRLEKKGEGTYYNQISETATYGGSNFSNLLEDNDILVSPISTKPIEYKELQKYAGNVVLILFSSSDCSDKDYSDDEIDAIEKFVKEGGGLFLTRESWKGAGEHGTGEIAKKFGVTFARDGDICHPIKNYKSEKKNVVEIFVGNNSDSSLNTTQHAITEDIGSFYLVSGTYIIQQGSSNVLASADNDAWFDIWDKQKEGIYGNKEKDDGEKTGPFPVLSVMDYGEGRVVFMGDKSLFVNCWLDESKNKDLGLNIVKWLVKLS